MKSLLKFLGLCALVLFFLYVFGELMQDKNRKEHEEGLQRCRAHWKACLAGAKTEAQQNHCSGELDLCIENLP